MKLSTVIKKLENKNKIMEAVYKMAKSRANGTPEEYIETINDVYEEIEKALKIPKQFKVKVGVEK